MWMKTSLLLCLLFAVATTTTSNHVNNNNADGSPQSETHHPTIKEKEYGRNHGINDDDYLKALDGLKASQIPVKNLGNVMASFKTNVHDPEHPKEHHDLQHLRAKRSNDEGLSAGGWIGLILGIILCCCCYAGIGYAIYYCGTKKKAPPPPPLPPQPQRAPVVVVDEQNQSENS